MLKTLSFIANHPLTRGRPLAGFARFLRWQIQSRMQREVEVTWIGGAKLVARNGMAGATGNIYCGLHEFADMAFVIHLLRPADLFVDVGANIGSYTILASAVVGARAVAVEPDPQTMSWLRRNTDINRITNRVTTVEMAVGPQAGTARFTVGLDSTNHIASVHDLNVREVAVETLDQILRGEEPILIKLDVEGHEAGVIAGASETLKKSSLLAVQTESTDNAVVEALVAAGFVRMYYEPFSRRLFDSPQHADSNALFVRSRDVVDARLRGAPYRRIFELQV
jgi:FkbM family methyltransferase